MNLDYLSATLRGLQVPEALIRNRILWSRHIPSGLSTSILSWESPSHEACDYYYHKHGTYRRLSEEGVRHWLQKKTFSRIEVPPNYVVMIIIMG